MKTARKGFTSEVTDCLRIGERFLLSFDDPGLEAPPYQGRLQDLRKDGLLCIDAPTDLRPPKGTSVTVSSLRNDMDDYTFSSQIYGRGRLRGRVPVILLRPPAQIEKTQRRGAYRVSVCLRAQALWTTADDPESGVAGKRISKPGVLTNLSGGGAQIFLRAQPEADSLRLNLTAPTGFVEELAKRRATSSRRGATIHIDPFLKSCEKIRSRLNAIEADIAKSRLHLRDSRGAIYAVSVAFSEPQEICYQLVRYLERQSIRKGLRDDGDSRPTGHRPAATSTSAIEEESDHHLTAPAA
jgi:c-di-GMP-binding flagellar brake protein YcgR